MALGAGPDEVAQALLELRGTDRVSTLSAHSAGGTVGAATVVDDQALSADHVDRLGERLQQALAAHSLANPLRPGLPLAQVAGRLGVTADIVQVVAAHLEGLRVVEGRISLGDQESAPEDDAIWLAARARLGAGGLDVPPWRALGLERELVYALIGRGALVKVSDEVACLPEQIDLVKDTLRAMPAQFTVSQFRDRAGLSRKLAVPLLEWCDRQELTVRSGDQRSVRRGALSES
jgi:selenocysteine-specific elongation factor